VSKGFLQFKQICVSVTDINNMKKQFIVNECLNSIEMYKIITNRKFMHKFNNSSNEKYKNFRLFYLSVYLKLKIIFFEKNIN